MTFKALSERFAAVDHGTMSENQAHTGKFLQFDSEIKKENKRFFMSRHERYQSSISIPAASEEALFCTITAAFDRFTRIEGLIMKQLIKKRFLSKKVNRLNFYQKC